MASQFRNAGERRDHKNRHRPAPTPGTGNTIDQMHRGYKNSTRKSLSIPAFRNSRPRNIVNCGRRLGTLFFLEARVVAGDALGMLKIQTEAGSVSVGHAFRRIRKKRHRLHSDHLRTLVGVRLVGTFLCAIVNGQKTVPIVSLFSVPLALMNFARPCLVTTAAFDGRGVTAGFKERRSDRFAIMVKERPAQPWQVRCRLSFSQAASYPAALNRPGAAG